MSKRDNLSKLRKAIEELIEISASSVSFDTSEKTRLILKNHKDSFITASELILGMYEMESAENSGKVNSKWYYEKLLELKGAGENTIAVMFDGIESEITRSNGGTMNNDIIAKREAFLDIRLMKEKIESIKSLIKMNEGKDDNSFEINRESSAGVHSFCLEYADKR